MGQSNTQLSRNKIVYVVNKPTEKCLLSIKGQSYPGVELLAGEENHPSLLFNRAILECKNTLLFAFIDGASELTINATQIIMDHFLYFQNQNIGAFYTDFNTICGEYYVPNHYKSYNKQLLKQNVINPNVFINGLIHTPLFNKELDHLYFYDALLKISQNSILYHIPKITYSVPHIERNISNDLQKMNINVNTKA